MWDYDKLFAVGNVISFHVGLIKGFSVSKIDERLNKILHSFYKNDSLSYCPDCFIKGNATKIQYIIRRDKHGNVIEKLFDRDTDMPNEERENDNGLA